MARFTRVAVCGRVMFYLTFQGMARLSSVFPRNMRAERVRRDWDQAELGDRIGGWTRTMVGDLETGRRKLSVDDIAPICTALSLSLAELAIGADADELAALGLQP
jgi:transcriptional regulator with XRE-family HTH domain